MQHCVIDSHHHLWDLLVHPQPWIDETMAAIDRSFDVDDLRAAMAGTAVTHTVVVQAVPEPAETEQLLAIANDTVEIVGVVGWVDLTATDVEAEIGRLRDVPGGDLLVGVRHIVQAEPAGYLDRPDVRRGIAAVGRAGLAYDLLLRAEQLPEGHRLAMALPGTRFVLDHLAKPDIRSGDMQAWRDDLLALAACENVAAKLSGLVTEADRGGWCVEDLASVVDTAVEAFGPQRLMFGSDWPVCLLAATYGRWVATAEELLAPLGAEDRARVWAGTAADVYLGGILPAVG